MSIRLEIVVDSMSELIRQLEDFALSLIDTRVEVLDAPADKAEVIETAVADKGDAPVEAEEVKPPRKPRTSKKLPEAIELAANEPSTAAPVATETLEVGTVVQTAAVEAHLARVAEAAQFPDVEDVRKKVIAFISETAFTPDQKRTAFDALRTAVGVSGPVSEWPVEKFAAVLAHIVEKSAA